MIEDHTGAEDGVRWCHVQRCAALRRGPHDTSLLPADLTPEQLAATPVLEAVGALLIEDLTDDEADAFFDALGL